MDPNLFCPECRNLLDLPGDEEFVTCSVCGYRQAAHLFENRPVVTTSRSGKFGDMQKLTEAQNSQAKGSKAGATIKEKCPKCDNPEMTFHTMQLRSADEGQTVFYECPKCSFKFSLNT